MAPINLFPYRFPHPPNPQDQPYPRVINTIHFYNTRLNYLPATTAGVGLIWTAVDWQRFKHHPWPYHAHRILLITWTFGIVLLGSAMAAGRRESNTRDCSDAEIQFRAWYILKDETERELVYDGGLWGGDVLGGSVMAALMARRGLGARVPGFMALDGRLRLSPGMGMTGGVGLGV